MGIYLSKCAALLAVLVVLVGYVENQGDPILNMVAIVSALIIGTYFSERWGKEN